MDVEFVSRQARTKSFHVTSIFEHGNEQDPSYTYKRLNAEY